MIDAKGKPKEDVEYHLPNRNKIRLWCRQIEWNLLYWKNGPLGHAPDPFEMWYDLPYYPYWKDSTTNKPIMVDVVSSKRKPVDMVKKYIFFLLCVFFKLKKGLRTTPIPNTRAEKEESTRDTRRNCTPTTTSD